MSGVTEELAVGGGLLALAAYVLYEVAGYPSPPDITFGGGPAAG